jgi:hypothetical protein
MVDRWRAGRLKYLSRFLGQPGPHKVGSNIETEARIIYLYMVIRPKLKENPVVIGDIGSRSQCYQLSKAGRCAGRDCSNKIYDNSDICDWPYRPSWRHRDIVVTHVWLQLQSPDLLRSPNLKILCKFELKG